MGDVAIIEKDKIEVNNSSVNIIKKTLFCSKKII